VSHVPGVISRDVIFGEHRFRNEKAERDKVGQNKGNQKIAAIAIY